MMHETTATSRLREFIDGCLLKKKGKYELPLVDGEFPIGKFINLVKECPSNRVYFNVYKFDYLYTDMEGERIATFLDVDDLVPFLFDKIELFGWSVKAINYIAHGSGSGRSNWRGGKDMCYMWMATEGVND